MATKLTGLNASSSSDLNTLYRIELHLESPFLATPVLSNDP
ncbi:hypothetical protein [Enterococcus faecium]|nr:hypothetical protein [Enterococcus faecium]